jgi:hypothetical protein
MSILESYYRLPPAFASREPRLVAGGSRSHRVTDAIKALYAERRETPAPRKLASWLGERLHVEDAQVSAGTSLTALVDDLRLERYQMNEGVSAGSLSSLATTAYYLVRPLLTVGVRKHLQRFALRDWKRIAFPEWPVDTTVETILETALATMLQDQVAEMPFIWFWPDGHDACAIVTHDVETAAGRDFCRKLIDVEEPFGIRSSFEIVPEQRYEVTDGFLSSIRARGCEICLHGLNHDYRLFAREDRVIELAKKINEYVACYGAIGFRSPVMYRNVDWFKYFDFKYDMSLPNVAHLDPQRGGCCTVMPYSIGRIVELPTTTIQDYALFHNIGRRDTAIWEQQIELILKRHGLISFIIHPDYTLPRWAQALYGKLLGRLERLRDVGDVWIPLPRDVYQWWTARAKLRLVNVSGTWRIEGEGHERASIAWMRLDGDKLRFTRGA